MKTGESTADITESTLLTFNQTSNYEEFGCKSCGQILTLEGSSICSNKDCNFKYCSNCVEAINTNECLNCNQKFIGISLSNNELEQLKRIIVTCKYLGCRQRFRLKDMSKHELVCESKKIKCDYCFKDITGFEFENHQQNCSGTINIKQILDDKEGLFKENALQSFNIIKDVFIKGLNDSKKLNNLMNFDLTNKLDNLQVTLYKLEDIVENKLKYLILENQKLKRENEKLLAITNSSNTKNDILNVKTEFANINTFNKINQIYKIQRVIQLEYKNLDLTESFFDANISVLKTNNKKDETFLIEDFKTKKSELNFNEEETIFDENASNLFVKDTFSVIDNKLYDSKSRAFDETTLINVVQVLDDIEDVKLFKDENDPAKLLEGIYTSLEREICKINFTAMIASYIYLAEFDYGNLVIVGLESGEINMHNVTKGYLIRRYEQHKSCVYGLVYMGYIQAGYFISGSEDKLVKLFDVSSNKPIKTISHTAEIYRMTAILYKKAGYFAVGDSKGVISLYNLQETEKPKKTKSNKNAIFVLKSIEIIPYDCLISGHEKGDIFLWRINDLDKKQKFAIEHKGSVRDIAMYKENKVLSCSEDKSIKLWALNQFSSLHTFIVHNDWVTSVGVLLNADIMVSASRDKTVKVINITTKEELKDFEYEAGVTKLKVLTDCPHKLIKTHGYYSIVFS